ncbi:MAG: helix-turn-helix domain-containing protein [Tannerella sp.]|jgi:AraC-like DNA-binding protein|nr:helix-turn-helix domain-containing protein [Tannerella sp.]
MSQIAHTLKTIKEAVASYDNYQDEVMILEFDHTSLDDLKSFAPLNPSRFDSVILIGVSDGEMEIQVDYITYKAGKNSLVLIMPTHITFFTKGSNNLKGWVLTISKSYITTLSFSQQQQPTVISYMQLKKNPLTAFEPYEYKSLYSSLDFVRGKMRKPTHLFYKETINIALKMFFLDLGNLYLAKREHYIAPSLSRQEELFIDFQTLLREHCKKQHDVKFYANKLCITTQYLSSILKEQSGKSASQWIQEALMIEAKGMLKSPRINVQQVADELNFPDQSTFGKFFKKHAGLSPLAFRKS